MDDREEIRSGDIEKGSSGERGHDGSENLACMRKKHIREVESCRCGESENHKREDLGLSAEPRFLEYGGKRERNGDLVDGDSEKYAISDSLRYPESGPDSESIEERMDENRDPGHERHVIVVFVRILMGMIPVLMVVLMSGQELFHEVDDEESAHEGIDSELARSEGLRQYMHERNREHGTGPERDEEIQDGSIDFFEKIQSDPDGGDAE